MVAIELYCRKYEGCRKEEPCCNQRAIYLRGVVCAPAANRNQAGGANMETAPAVTIYTLLFFKIRVLILIKAFKG
jgi:hypothetical protein